MQTESSHAAGPVLSIMVPTYNRARYLRELLASLLPQLAGVSSATVELVVSDNCSTDDTPAAVAEFAARGLRVEHVRNAVNIGADANFMQCFHRARGHYVWVLGDDDIVVAGALGGLLELLSDSLRDNDGAGTGDASAYDIVYLSTFGFAGEYAEGTTRDRLGRYAELVTDSRYFLGKVNALIGLLSANIVNKPRLLATTHPPLAELDGSNLMQVGWLFPLLRQRPVRVLYVWQRLLGYRLFNSGGWGACEVFGLRLNRIAALYFAATPALHAALMNGVLRYWLPDAIFEIRSGLHATMNAEETGELRSAFGGNWRYWLCVWPVAELPLPLARPAYRLLQLINRAVRAAAGMAHHWFARGTYLAPR